MGDAGAQLVGWVLRANGSALVALTSRATATEGVHAVAGDITLAGGEFERADVRLSAEGLYVLATGELRLRVAQSRVFAPVDAAEAAVGGRSYHAAVAAAAAESARLSERGWPRPPRLSHQGGNATGMRRQCSFALTAQLPGTVGAAWHGRPNVRLAGALVSEDCGGLTVLLNTSLLHTAALVEKASNAALMIAFTGVALISVTGRQMEASMAGGGNTRVALGCVFHQGVLDSFTCLVHLTGGLMVDALMAAFFTTALVFFVQFSFFEMRWMMSIARALAPDVPWQAQLNALQTRFYVALVAGAAVYYVLQNQPLLLALAYGSFWSWQIVHTARADAARPLTVRYVLCASLARLPMPLYALACPSNWLNLPTQPAAAAALVLWIGAQAAVLCAQCRFGARWFVPQRWRPQRYSYARPATAAERAAAANEEDAEAAAATDCVICMLPLSLDALQERMLTPCGHAFHNECLLRWMDIRHECPVCRRALPLP